MSCACANSFLGLQEAKGEVSLSGEMRWGVFLLSFAAHLFLFDLFSPGTPHDLDHILDWALLGPGAATAASPIHGVYLFRGLNPPLLADTSYCDWDAAEQVVSCPTWAPGFFHAVADSLDYTGTPFAPTTFPFSSPGLSGRALIRVLRLGRLLRLRIVFQFDARLREAATAETVLGFGVAGRQAGGLGFKLRRLGGGAWRRVNLWHGVEAESYYDLLPVLTARGGLNRRNLALAKEKLGGSQLLSL